MKKILFTLLITSTIVISQDCNEDRESLNSLKKDVTILSDDKMEGRETGTKGEKIALKHIIDLFIISLRTLRDHYAHLNRKH